MPSAIRSCRCRSPRGVGEVRPAGRMHATLLLVAGVPVHVVADRLGHADPSITLRVYAHVIRRHAAGIADVFAAADHVDEDQDDEDDGRDPSAVVPC